MMFCIEGQRLLGIYFKHHGAADKLAQWQQHVDSCPFCQNYKQELYEASKVAVHPPMQEAEA